VAGTDERDRASFLYMHVLRAESGYTKLLPRLVSIVRSRLLKGTEVVLNRGTSPVF